MFTKSKIAFLLFIFLITATANPIFAQTQDKKQAEWQAKVKSKIEKLGVGENSLIEVKLKDKTKVKGYIGEISDDYFVVIDKLNGTSTKVPYPQVKQAKGNNLSTGAKIAIGLGILAAVLVILLIFENYG